MSATTRSSRPKLDVFLLDQARKRPERFAALRPHVASTVSGLRSLVGRASKDSFWVSYSSDLTDALVSALPVNSRTLGSGLFIHALDLKAIPALSSVFQPIAFLADGGFIPPEELAEVLEAENRANLFIGGIVNRKTETITFWRGNLKSLTVSFSAFGKSGDGTMPDFDSFSVIDCGQTVQLGGYEAAADAILYEYDPDYRREINKTRRETERTFGASLRRLRKQRGLRREDFGPDLSAKTIARIEQGRVTRIQRRTREVLADRLSVRPDDIETY